MAAETRARGELAQPFSEIRRRLPDFTPSVIFDVGGNVGQTTLGYARTFTQAALHLFEPVPASIAAATDALRPFGNVHLHQTAIGDEDGTIEMVVEGTSTMNRVGGKPRGGERVTVPMTRLDTFAKAQGIERVDFIKVDVEGHEIPALAGAGALLRRTGFVQIEVGMNAGNAYHTPLHKVWNLVELYGFEVFSILHQVPEKRSPALRRADFVFVNPAYFS